jgi:hypothetical protein
MLCLFVWGRNMAPSLGHDLGGINHRGRNYLGILSSGACLPIGRDAAERWNRIAPATIVSMPACP